jgi:hypothetical protein
VEKKAKPTRPNKLTVFVVAENLKTDLYAMEPTVKIGV